MLLAAAAVVVVVVVGGGGGGGGGGGSGAAAAVFVVDIFLCYFVWHEVAVQEAKTRSRFKRLETLASRL